MSQKPKFYELSQKPNCHKNELSLEYFRWIRWRPDERTACWTSEIKINANLNKNFLLHLLLEVSKCKREFYIRFPSLLNVKNVSLNKIFFWWKKCLRWNHFFLQVESVLGFIGEFENLWVFRRPSKAFSIFLHLATNLEARVERLSTSYFNILLNLLSPKLFLYSLYKSVQKLTFVLFAKLRYCQL